MSSSSIARPVPSRYMSTTVKGAAKVQKQLTVKLPNSLVKSILLFPPLPLPLIPSLLSLTYPFISSLVFTVFERLFSFIHLFVHSFIVFVLFIDSFLNSLTYTPFISHWFIIHFLTQPSNYYFINSSIHPSISLQSSISPIYTVPSRIQVTYQSPQRNHVRPRQGPGTSHSMTCTVMWMWLLLSHDKAAPNLREL